MAWTSPESLYMQSFNTNNVTSTTNGDTKKNNESTAESEHALEIKTTCTRLRDKITVLIELAPTPETVPDRRHPYGTGSRSPMTSSFGGGSGGGGNNGGRYRRLGVFGQQSSNNSVTAPPRSPMRLVCVVDVSHSMAEPFGLEPETIIDRRRSPVSSSDDAFPVSESDDDNGEASSYVDGDSMGKRRSKGGGTGSSPPSRTGLGLSVPKLWSKLDRVKLFGELLVKSIGADDQLSIVTFGTTSRVVSPMQRMTDAAKRDTLNAIRGIEVAGVTNMSAGIFTAIDQFNVSFAKCRYFNDNILLFTDGMANEGIADSSELIREIRKRIRTLRENCHFDNDYTIKFSTLGTSGFLPEVIYDVGQAFGSDAFYFIDDRMSIEMDMMIPFLLRKSVSVSNVHMTVTSLHGVQLDRADVTTEYVTNSSEQADPPRSVTTENFLIHEMAASTLKHITCRIKLPSKHKKLLKGNDVIKINVSYKDQSMSNRSMEHRVPYSAVPLKDSQNSEADVLLVARQEVRRRVCIGLGLAARSVARLDRQSAKNTLTATADDIAEYVDTVFDGPIIDEERRAELTSYVAGVSVNLTHFQRLIGDLSVRWDEAWARIKAVESSMTREVPTSSGLYASQSEIFGAPASILERLAAAADVLADVYRAKGISVDVLEKYHLLADDLEEIVDKDSLYGQSMAGVLGYS